MTVVTYKLETFEGPLDLLLHLIDKAEIDIQDIPISDITDQYMAYLHSMQELELDITSEFLVMAATLLSIKSKLYCLNRRLSRSSRIMITWKMRIMIHVPS